MKLRIMAIRVGRILCVFPLACCVLLAGCRKGNETAEVAGAVTLGGKPLADGVVTFRPTAGTAGPDFSGIVAEGNYRVPMLVLPGDYRVEVRAWRKTGRILKLPGGVESPEMVSAIRKTLQGAADQAFRPPQCRRKQGRFRPDAGIRRRKRSEVNRDAGRRRASPANLPCTARAVELRGEMP